MPKIILKINSASDPFYDSDNICCYLVDASLSPDMLEKCRKTDKMVLICGVDATSKCKQHDLDGIVIEPDVKKPLKIQIKKELAEVGQRKVLGVVVPAHRHEAMLAGETEPDFIIFKFTPQEAVSAFEVIRWYNELFLIQSAIDLTLGLQNITDIDVDFVIINSCDYKDFGC